MRQDDDKRMRVALEELRSARPDPIEVGAAGQRIANRLGMVVDHDRVAVSDAHTIADCGDVQLLLTSYRKGDVSESRKLVIQSHLRECGACLRQCQSGSESSVLDWSTPKVVGPVNWRLPKFGLGMTWVLAPTAVLVACLIFAYRAYWQVPPGVRAEVQSIDGMAYLVSGSDNHQLAPGDQLEEGAYLRTSGGAHAVLRLVDGSTVEVNQRSVLGLGARGHDMTVSLDSGAVIVQAAKRTSGHLFVKTPDCRVAVTGTVFSVDSGIKGSRVAVLQGAVEVKHAGVETLVNAGGQIATSDSLGSTPVAQQIAWSHDREKYLSLLAQFSILQHNLEQIPFPQSRYGSDLLTRVPSDTLLYVSIPNLGEFLSEANKTFDDQLQQSPALQQWWNRGGNRNTEELDSLVDKLHQMSQYLGDEAVIVGAKNGDTPDFAVIAGVQRSGLSEFLQEQFASRGAKPGLTVLEEHTLKSATSQKGQSGEYALVRQHEVVFSNNISTLKRMDAQLSAGSSGFASTDFGKQIQDAYTRGAGIILAADLHSIVSEKLAQSQPGSNAVIGKSGMDGIRYLIAEHRETNGIPENHLNIQFAGTRQRVASWLDAPAPIGSLDFITPNASIAVAGLSKDPKAIADDIMSMTAPQPGAENQDWSEAESKLRINFRDDIAANLGGDFLIALDGPVLPTPSWKAVIEIHDPAKLEKTIETLSEAINSQIQGKYAHKIAIQASDVNAQRFYSVTDLNSGNALAYYTFADGYMILAPSRALVMESIRAHASGNSLARSAAFKATLPKDQNENYSAIAYQNLSPVLTPLLSQLNGESAKAVQQLAADARPTAVCAWGRDDRIEAASDSHLFGFDFLTIGSLINPGNKHAEFSVRN